MSSIVFTLIVGVLAGIAALVGGATPLEMVLLLGVLGLTHMTVVAGRKASQTASERNRRSFD